MARHTCDPSFLTTNSIPAASTVTSAPPSIRSVSSGTFTSSWPHVSRIENPGAAGKPAAAPNCCVNSARTARYTDGARRVITVPESMSTLLAPNPAADTGRRVAAEGERARNLAGGGRRKAVGEGAAVPGSRLRDERQLGAAKAHEPRRAAEQAAVAEPAPEHEAVELVRAERERVRGEHAAAERPVAVGQRVVALVGGGGGGGGAGSWHAGGGLEGGRARRGVAPDRGVGGGAGGVEERVALRVASRAGLALHPREVAARVHDDGEVGGGGGAAAETDGGDVVERLEANAGGQRDLGGAGLCGRCCGPVVAGLQ
nr:unnamed protein product [Digitaria exilis]